MSTKLKEASAWVCELCMPAESLFSYNVRGGAYPDKEMTVCITCLLQIKRQLPMGSAHRRFLAEIIWSEKRAIRVLAWRLLERMKAETWAAGNLKMMYKGHNTQKWAEAGKDTDGLLAPAYGRKVKPRAACRADKVHP